MGRRKGNRGDKEGGGQLAWSADRGAGDEKLHSPA